MARNWIVVGDITSSGGRVVTGSPETDIDGKSVSRFNDKATCPLHKGVFPIVGGCDPTIIIDGQPVALHGAKLACGCTVLAVQQHHVFVDHGGGGGSVSTPTPAPAAAPAAPHNSLYDLRFQLKEESTGKPLAGSMYRITLESGKVFEGIADEHGMTQPAHSNSAEVATIEVNYHAQSEAEPAPCSESDACAC